MDRQPEETRTRWVTLLYLVPVRDHRLGLRPHVGRVAMPVTEDPQMTAILRGGYPLAMLCSELPEPQLISAVLEAQKLIAR